MKEISMKNDSFCIYGAGIVATSIYKAIKTLYGKQPLSFIVSDSELSKKSTTPEKIDSIPVIGLSEWQERQQGEYCKHVTLKYIVAVPEVHHAVIMKSLLEKGVHKEDVILITGDMENKLMEEYFWLKHSEQGKYGQGARTVKAVLDKTFQDKAYLEKKNCDIIFKDDAHIGDAAKEEKAVSIEVFQAKCHVDKPLTTSIVMPDYIVPIQAGTVFADKKIAAVQDNVGDNISHKNRNYCELTASYYAWKNSKADYKGLCHYRRIFDITEEQMQRLLGMEDKWDVILPYPSIHYPDISTQHVRYIGKEDWKAMMQALEEKAPEYYRAYLEAVANGEQQFLNYNMLIAKKKIFDDYCNFLFEVLARTEELTIPKGENRADRFAGYMGENLTTIYFLKNREHLKILYAGKKWLV